MTIERWVREQKKKQEKKKDKARAPVTRAQLPHRDPRSKLVKPQKAIHPPVVVGTAGVVHKNPSKTPAVVADTSVKEHLYGWGGIRNNVLGSKGGSTDSIGDKDKHSKTKGTKTQTTFMPDPTKIY